MKGIVKFKLQGLYNIRKGRLTNIERLYCSCWPESESAGDFLGRSRRQHDAHLDTSFQILWDWNERRCWVQIATLILGARMTICAAQFSQRWIYTISSQINMNSLTWWTPTLQWPFWNPFGFFSPLYPIRYLLSQHEAPRAHTHRSDQEYPLSGKPPAKHISTL